MPANGSYTFGAYTLDLKRGTLVKMGVDVKLRPKSFEVLRLLVERHGQLVTKEELLRTVWHRAIVTDGAIVQCLIDVRRAIGDEAQHLIRTVPRRGYIFDVPVVESDALVPSGSAEARSSALAPDASIALRHRTVLPSAVAALMLVAIGAALWWGMTTREQGAIAPQPAPSQAQRNSIAVLPFVDLSPEQDQEYFSDGMSEEILNLLARAPNLRVIARTSSFSFKGRNADIAEIAAKLNVAHVLEGSVRKSGSRLRITAQLVDAANSTHLWSETYDRELQDAFAVQSEIATRVFEALRVTMMDKAIAGPATAPNANAHEHFLRARFFYNRRAPGDIERAKDYYEHTLLIDPRYARAWAGLSGVYGVLLSTGNISPESGSAKRLAAAERALVLDPNLAEAHVRAAWHYLDVGDRQRAEEHARRAYAIDPDDPLVLTHFANTLAWEGRFDESLSLLRHLEILDPISSLSHNVLASHLMAAGRYDEARAERLKELELNPAAKPDIDIDLGQIFILQRRFAEARELIEHWPAGDRNQGLAIVEHALGRNAAAEAALHELTRGTDPGDAVRVAEVHAQRGNVDEAFRWMETARARFGPDVWLTPEWRWAWQLRFSPFLRPLHGDPRWKATSSLLPPEEHSDSSATEAREASRSQASNRRS